ncbi:hypothetical protein ANANG_G00269910 [Anguilla anguilla]|uniref:Uncharacterized protein n=1 Tax=Anguilla anguilla TaxID=7936 RepID=A0A9D3LYV5_ANGAN|nr:hypothetical protein ANANG_G00269910 [Anguilla anguilla]
MTLRAGGGTGPPACRKDAVDAGARRRGLGMKPRGNARLAQSMARRRFRPSLPRNRAKSARRGDGREREGRAVWAPLGCSTYDNLDSVSSVLLQSPESKLHLQGLQVIFPEYLQEKFVQSALSYIMCNGEGEYVCRDSQCICQCADEFPQCNCPITDIQIMENTLLGMAESWAASYKDFENSDEFKSFLKRLPSTHFLPVSSVHLLWGGDWDLQARYRLLQSSLEAQRLKMQRTARKLFGLSIRCHHNPNHQMPRERSVLQWLNRVQSFLYCNENGFWGTFLESQRTCVCHTGVSLCQRPVPCVIGGNNSCAMCSLANISQCGSCNKGFKLYRGAASRRTWTRSAASSSSASRPTWTSRTWSSSTSCRRWTPASTSTPPSSATRSAWRPSSTPAGGRGCR